ncbi:transcriptional regulator [Spongiactinospora gelatinilytica]|uniref:Transcriptional regulator n=1 Tax=Spongiactinospora gelatinilytica TaxID=2666298 RepID=A0A2W2GFV2_9ACTN|nr:transcriptional regulator [Spongiactinospora gelatinilytica]PZG47471.1 transcriptional regulator [Spongiactinospora gelatinilytica]
MPVADSPDRHPLAVILAARNWTAEQLLRRMAHRHQQLGFGGMAIRREKVSRWLGGTTPDRAAQRALADVLGIDAREVEQRGWPGWLRAAIDGDRILLESPWTPAGTVKVLAQIGGCVDRRHFMVTGGGALAAVTAQWAAATPACGIASSGQASRETITLLHARLDALRRLDDQVGAADIYDAAAAELRFIVRLLTNTSHGERVGGALYGCAAEAARLAGWCAYDTGRHPTAEALFQAALRAAGSAGDDDSGAIVLAFWANLRYAAASDAPGALDLLGGALHPRMRISSPRVHALLHARRARAYSVLGEPTAAYRAIDDAFTAYDEAPAACDDLPQMYWITAGELHQAAGSAALTLGEPRRALEHFDAAVGADEPYDPASEARGAAIYLARRAEAHLAMGDLDAAVAAAHDVVRLMGGVDSARSTSTLEDLRRRLRAHRGVPVVADFLHETA